jgi:hypothetical protein
MADRWCGVAFTPVLIDDMLTITGNLTRGEPMADITVTPEIRGERRSSPAGAGRRRVRVDRT